MNRILFGTVLLVLLLVYSLWVQGRTEALFLPAADRMAAAAEDPGVSTDSVTRLWEANRFFVFALTPHERAEALDSLFASLSRAEPGSRERQDLCAELSLALRQLAVSQSLSAENFF